MAVDGFRLLPLGELSASDHAVEWHPKAGLAAGSDSNPLQGADAIADTYARGVAGLDLRALAADALTCTARAEATALRYRRTPERSFIGGDADLGVRCEDERSSAGLGLGWRRDDEPLPDTAEQVRRETWTAHAEAAREAARSRFGLMLDGSATRYLQDGPGFTREERAQRRLGIGAEAARLAERGELHLRLEAAAWRYPQGGRYNDGESGSAVAGGSWTPERRLELGAEAGYGLHRYAAQTGGLPGNDDQRAAGPLATLTVRWPWEADSAIGLRGASGILDGSESNAVRFLILDADLRQRLRDRLAGLLWAGIGRYADSGAPGGGDADVRIHRHAGAGMEYLLREGVGLRGTISWEDIAATIGTDWSRLSAEVELAVAF